MGARAVEPRRGLRISAAVLAIAAMAALVGLVLNTAWANVSSRSTVASAERAGVGYLRPLTSLIQALAVAETAAVRGQRVDTGALAAAAKNVGDADAQHGATLRTSGRWAQLRDRVSGLVSSPGRGAAAYQHFGDAIALAVDLAAAVGDASSLLLDPALDSAYLSTAALDGLPVVMVGAARAASLAALYPTAASSAGSSGSGPGNGGSSTDGSSTGNGGQSTGSGGQSSGGGEPPGGANQAAAIAVARYQVAVAAADVTASLRKSIETTSRPSLGATLTSQQDAFADAVDTLTPPAVVQQPVAAASAQTLAAANSRVQTAALALAAALFDQLDGLLADRQSGLALERKLLIAGGVAVLVLAVLLLWLLAPARRTGGVETDIEEEAEPERPQIALIEARDLLGTEELVHVGRGVRPRPQERDGAE